MTVAFLMDHHMPRVITLGLRRREVDVLTAYEDGSHELDDPQLLDRAGSLSRLLVTNDAHFLAEAARRQAAGASFPGIVCAHFMRLSIGEAISELELIAKAGAREDFDSKVVYLPL